MAKIILPKRETGGEIPEDYESPSVPPGITNDSQWQEHFFNLLYEQNERLTDLELKTNEYKQLVIEYKKEFDKVSYRNIETIGVFSAVLAILIIDVSIVKSAGSFLGAVLLIVSLTCSTAIFAILIHSFFSTDNERNTKAKYFWIPMLILIVFIIIGIVASAYNWRWANCKFLGI